MLEVMIQSTYMCLNTQIGYLNLLIYWKLGKEKIQFRMKVH